MTQPIQIPVTVTTPWGEASHVFTVQPPPPVILSIEPASGPAEGGTRHLITGLYLTGATVAFAGRPALDVVVSEDGTTITCTTPPLD